MARVRLVLMCVFALLTGGCLFQIAVPAEVLGVTPQVAAVTAAPSVTSQPSATATLPPTATSTPTPTPTPLPPTATPIAGGQGKVLLQCREEPDPWIDMYVYDLQTQSYDYAITDQLRGENERTSNTYVTTSPDGSQLLWQENYCYGVTKKQYGTYVREILCGFSTTKTFLSDPSLLARTELSMLPTFLMNGGTGILFADVQNARRSFASYSLYDTASQQETPLGQASGYRPYYSAAVSPDGRYLLLPDDFLSTQTGIYTYNFVLIDAQAKTATGVLGPSHEVNQLDKITWMPDGSGFLVSVSSERDEDVTGLYLSDLTGQNYRQLVAGRVLDYAVAPDGKTVAYSLIAGSQILLYDIENSVERTIETPGSYIDGLAYHPSGKALYYWDAANDEKLLRVTVENGSIQVVDAEPRLTTYEDIVYDWSPDGQWFLLHQPDAGVFISRYSDSVLCSDGGCMQLSPPGTSYCYIAAWLR